MSVSSQEAYRQAGVDLDSAAAVVDWAKAAASPTRRADLVPNHSAALMGGFSGAFRIPEGYQSPVLLAACDGVGTKLELALVAKQYDTVGIDLVAMSVNDLLTQGGEPLIFLDYIATGKICSEATPQILAGIGKGCELSNCTLLGGETAEMPGFYPNGQFDLAGFCVGVVEADALYPKTERLKAGQAVLGLTSNGLHSNGYSLVRKLCFADHELPLNHVIPGEEAPLIDVLLRPTRIYVRLILELLKAFPGAVSAMVHITGGGFIDNLPRVLPDSLGIHLDASSWPRPPIYPFLQELGSLDEATLFHTFNAGIGFVLTVDAAQADTVLAWLNEQPESLRQGAEAYRVGDVVERQSGRPQVSWS